MAKRQLLKANLSVSSLNALKKQLLDYKAELNRKCETFVKMLADEGITVGKQNVGGFGKYITFSMLTEPRKDGCKAIILASENGKIISSWQTKDGIKTAEVSPLLMAEFGSGWGAENPMKIPGVGQGTFPTDSDKNNAFNKEGWYWFDLDGNLNHSYGITAKMPMYKASLKIKEEVVRIARDVFGS